MSAAPPPHMPQGDAREKRPLPAFYRTPACVADPLKRLLPAFFFYLRVAEQVVEAGLLARKGYYTHARWMTDSKAILRGAEEVGGRIVVENRSGLEKHREPVVLVSNHMSTLETFGLMSLMPSERPLTFVVKESLAHYPVFGEILRAIPAIVVTRRDPRADLKTMLEEGTAHLQRGTSVIVFPSTTRTPQFDPAQFNTIGVKLAKRAGVKVVPTAVKTDFWGNGKRFKDLGPIDPQKTIRFALGEPLQVEGNGRVTHEKVVAFIKDHLARWKREEPVPPAPPAETHVI